MPLVESVPPVIIGYLVSRIGGEDGVSLEAMHWLRVLLAAGHRIVVVTGRVEPSAAWRRISAQPRLTVCCIDEADPDPHLAHNRREWQRLMVDGVVDAAFEARVATVQRAIGRVLEQAGVQLVVGENFTLPWHHLSMAVALGRLLRAQRLPAVLRGHDFPHDRPEYRWSTMPDAIRQLAGSCLLRAPQVAHVAINSRDAERYRQLAGIDDATVVANTIDVDDPMFMPLTPRARAAVRHALLGERADDFVALCPVRPVARKRIDVALELVRRLQAARPSAGVTLLISHHTRDAPTAELATLRAAASGAGVHLLFAAERPVRLADGTAPTPFDLYRVADLALYFSDFEGFGNALLECLACRLPIFVNAYDIFRRDIGPRGFDLPAVHIPSSFRFRDFLRHGLEVFDRSENVGALPAELDALVERAVALLDARRSGAEDGWTERSERYRVLVRRHFGYPVVSARLGALLARVLGSGAAGER